MTGQFDDTAMHKVDLRDQAIDALILANACEASETQRAAAWYRASARFACVVSSSEYNI